MPGSWTDAAWWPGALEAVFWLSLVAISYAYVGYPALVALAAWIFPAPRVRKAAITPPVTVVVVARDEEELLGEKLANCLALEYPPDKLDVLVVSDGSRDRTEEIASAFAHRGIRLLALPVGRGKSAALNRAVPLARGDILLFTDVRQQLAPDALRELVAHFADLSVGAVSGELHLERPAVASPSGGVSTYWAYEKLLRRVESRFDSTVGVTGGLYALRKELFRPLDERTILDDVAIPMDVVLSGRRALFEPAAAAWDRIPEDPAREYRRKVRTLAGNYQLVQLRPSLLDPRCNRLFWQFVSHKLARLAIPWCLVALFVSSAALSAAGPFYRTVLAAQAAVYALAAAAVLLRPLGRAPTALSVPYAFVLLNVAAAAALVGFVRGSEHAAWKRAAR